MPAFSRVLSHFSKNKFQFFPQMVLLWATHAHNSDKNDIFYVLYHDFQFSLNNVIKYS